jgi:presenilin-like A22 family membrane protease
MDRRTINKMIYFVLIYYIVSVFLSIVSIIFYVPLKIFAYNVLAANIAFIILAFLKEHYYD